MKLNINDPDYNDSLPSKQGRKSYLTEKFGDLYNLIRFDHPWYRSNKNDLPYVKANRILKKYLGKSFSKAFSEYCKQVEIYEQNEFLENFKNKYGNEPYYIIDKNGNIQFNPNSNFILNGNSWKRKINSNKKPIIFRSINYQEGYYGVREKQFFTESEYYRNFKYIQPESCYIRCVVNGFEKQFESEKDREYIRLTKEKNKQKKLLEKRRKKNGDY